jgi:phosphatidylserine decarboxylase
VKHKGKALNAAAVILGKGLMAVVLLAGVSAFLWPKSLLLAAAICALGLLFFAFVLWFFRDPDPVVPPDPALIVSPAHGTVDVIDETTESNVMGGPCRRVSIFLSVFNVHVQQSPVSGRVTYQKHTPGLFLNALKTESAAHNENVLIGFEASESPGVRIGVRLITGLIARRIIPWTRTGEVIAKGERISLIQFGSRVNIYLPLRSEITVKLGDKVFGGQTVVGRLLP